MLLWVSIGVTLIGVILLFIRRFISFRKWRTHKALGYMGAIPAVIGGILTMTMVAALAITYISLDGEIASDHERYNALVARYENANWYDRDEIAQSIQEWNESLANNQAMQKNFWLDPLIPDVFDQFKFIPLKRLEADPHEDS